MCVFSFVKDGSSVRQPSQSDLSGLNSSSSNDSANPELADDTSKMLTKNRSHHCVVSMVAGSDSRYALGALVLAQSFREHTKRASSIKMILLYDPSYNLSYLDIIRRSGLWDELRVMGPLPGVKSELWPYYYKYNAFRMSNCSRVLWMGSDSLVVKSIDDLFDAPVSPIAGVTDVFFVGLSWKNYRYSVYVNGDMLVFEPSPTHFDKLVQFSKEHPKPFGMGGDYDQAAINSVFELEMRALPWYYSVETNYFLVPWQDLRRVINPLNDSNLDGWNKANQKVLQHFDMWRTMHYAGKFKPWKMQERQTNIVRFLFAPWDNTCHRMISDRSALWRKDAGVIFGKQLLDNICVHIQDISNSKRGNVSGV
eukprot:jgi/Bigna1/133399/aug1.21_g8107